MKKKKPEVFWAVKGDIGFYTGTWLYRRNPYDGHARDTQMDGETYDQTWKRRRRDHGDRIVKVHLVEVKR